MTARQLIASLVIVLAGTSARADQKITRLGKAMGTNISLTMWGDDEAKAARAAQAVFREFDRVDRVMSSWLGTSDVSLINSAAGDRGVSVGDEVFLVVNKALAMAKKTGGAFDITVGAFRGLWKFDEDIDNEVPSGAEIAARTRLVGWRDVVVDRKNKTVKLRRKGMRITLGGIAKGYAVDRAVDLLAKMDVPDFILQAGGDLYVSGSKGGKPWVVGIRDPRGGRQTPFASAAIKDRTFSTSGDYERSFVKDGVRYHHILDPKTGRPADKCRSVTVMAKDAITADAWSTSLLVLGVDRGMAIVEKSPELEAVFVDAKNRVHVSSGLKGKLKIHRPPTSGI
ncbi:MAG: FAD:protein FMN transferase [Deltaproteobacteria bacterium]|nr:FAD:protein FMN transferase [Deltaproteobacteria bacterium]